MIVADEDVVGVIGTSCSGAAAAASPLISEAGMVMISGSNTSPALTSDLAGTAGPNYNPGYYRTAHNDLYQGAAAAIFAIDVLGVSTAAAIHDGAPYTTGLAQAFADAFEAAGGTITGFTAVNKGDTDMVPVLTEIASGAPEMLFFPIFQPEGDFIVQQVRGVAGMESTILMAADGLLNSNYMALEETEGMYFSGPDIRYGANTNQSTGQTADSFLAAYNDEWGEDPAAPFWAHSYDATTLLLDAIAAASYDDDGTLVIDRAGVREHLNAVADYSGIIGLISCDAFGDCGSQKITVIGHGDSTDVPASNANVVYEYAPGGSSLGEGQLVVPAPVPLYGGEVSIGVEAEATGLRPWEDACSSPCQLFMMAVHDRLMEQITTGDYSPQMAESLTSNGDYTVWTMVLRPGITFSNGDALTAQTIADMFPIQQTGAVSAGAVGRSGLVSVEAVGDLTVEYTLSATNVAFDGELALQTLGMVFHPGLAASDPDGYTLNPIGTGAFILETRDIDNETVFVRNPNYWMSVNGKQLPYLDRLIIRPIPDETSRLAALTSGTVDGMQTLRQATIRDARLADVVMHEFQGNNSGGGHFNVAVPPYDDVRVRRGLTLANNQDAVIEALGGSGISDPGTQFFSPDSPWYSQAVADAWPHFDFEAGKALLQEYVDDPTRSDGKAVGEKIDVELGCVGGEATLIAAMAVLEQLWTGTGLANVEVVMVADQPTHINVALGVGNAFVGEHGAHCWRFGDQQDPSVALGSAYGDPVTNPLNFSNYDNPEARAILAEAKTVADFESRRALYEQVGMIGATEVPMWFSGHTATALAFEEGIVGLDDWVLPDGTLGIGHPSAIPRTYQMWRTDG